VEMYSLELCLDGRWCCNNQIDSTCCNSNKGNFTFNLLSLAPGSQAKSPTSTTADTSAAVTVTSHVTTTLNGGANLSNGHSNTGVVVGASMGAVLGAMLVACSVALFLVTTRLRKNKKVVTNEKSEPQTYEWRAEMDAARVLPMELSGAAGAEYELDGRKGINYSFAQNHPRSVV
jgi:hypothetical protein